MIKIDDLLPYLIKTGEIIAMVGNVKTREVMYWNITRQGTELPPHHVFFRFADQESQELYFKSDLNLKLYYDFFYYNLINKNKEV